MNLNQQVKQADVGNVVQLFTIDATNLGGSIFYLTPSGLNVTWMGNDYIPFPIQLGNREFNIDGAPNRPTLSVAARRGSVLLSMVLAYGDLVGATVTVYQTFANYLDGAVDADTTQHFPVETYRIIQKQSLSADGIVFVLAVPLDQPNLQLPRRQILRDNVGGEYSLYAPGVSRSRSG